MRKGIIAAIIAGILAAGAFITVCIGSDGFKKRDVSTWFKTEQAAPQPDPTDIKLDSAVKDISALQTDITNIRLNISELTKQISDVTKRLETAANAETVTALTAELNELNTELAAMTDRVAALENQLAELNKCVKHEFVDGVCVKCSKAEKEYKYALDVISVNCQIRVFVNGVQKQETFGMGTNLYTLSELYDTDYIQCVTALTGSQKINVYKCTYTDDGEYTGYPTSDNVLLADKKYNKEFVTALSVLDPIYTLSSAADCLYIFEVA